MDQVSDTFFAPSSFLSAPQTRGGLRLPLFGRKARALSEQAEHARALLDASPFPFLEVAGDRVHAGEAARTLLGLKESEATIAQVCALAREGGDRLHQSLIALTNAHEPFALVLALVSGKQVKFIGKSGEGEGRRVNALWLEDQTQAHLERRAQAERIVGHESEARQFRQMLDALNFPCWRRDPKGQLVWCNLAYASALDCTPAEVVKDQKEITTTLKDKAGRTLHDRARREGKVVEQTKHVVIGGNRRLMEFRELPIEGGTLGFAFDMTALDDLRSELARHIASNSEVLETLSTAVAVFGADQKIQFHNSAFCTLWGLDDNWLNANQLLAQILDQLRETRQLPEQADFRSFKQGWLAMFTSLVEPHQDLMYRPDGTAIRLAIVPHPMGGLLFTFEDVTSRLALESNYNTLIAVQRETLDNLGEGIAVFGGDGRLDLWNPSFGRMWHFKEDVLTGRPHITELTAQLDASLTAGQDASGLKLLMVSNALDLLPRSGRIERGDGSVLEYHSVLLPDGGVLNSFLDVSDSVRVELALRERNAALIAADQLKLEFLGNVSYQLRTPLNVMIGFSEILYKQYFGELNEKQMEYAGGALEAGQKLVMLVDAILDLSTIEAGYMRLYTVPVKVSDILESIVVLAGDWAAKQEITLVMDCPDTVGTIEADERRVKQVLLNLISNALKFTPTGGRITLRAVRTPPGPGEQEVIVSVTDTGSGIPEADQARVFEPFESGKRKLASSAGVGLALVKSFIDLHGGRVQLESELGLGTTVSCFLPVRQPPRTEDN